MGPRCSSDSVMDSQFVPALADLIKANNDCGTQCHWQRRTGGRCTTPVAAADALERDSIILSIRRLIGNFLENGRLALATPDIVSKILNALKKVSMWLLCKKWHRKYSNTIVEKWCDELDELDDIDDPERRPARPNPRNQSTLPKQIIKISTEINIRTEINIQKGDKIFCHGKNKDGKGCARLINVKNREKAAAIVEILSKSRAISKDTEDYLLLLAQLLLCRRSHQDQAPEKVEEWLQKFRQIHATPDQALRSRPPSTLEPASSSDSAHTSRSPYATPPPRAKPTEKETPDSVTSSIFSRADSIATPLSSHNKRYSTRVENVDSPSPSNRKPRKAAPTETKTEPIGHTRITRSSTFTLPAEEAVSKFKPFSPKTREGIQTKIYEKIMRNIIPREEPAGFIYGFKRDRDRHIKVGFTCNIANRMSSWNTKCRQNVELVLEERMPHAAKVESLVHSILHQQRRKEVLVGGRCNDGKGCFTAHEEWFDVSIDRLREIVTSCKRWILARPYTERGVLKPHWATYVKKLYDSGSYHRHEEWRDWLDVAKATGEKKVTAPTVTETEIKSEDEDQFRTLRSKSRTFTEIIMELTGENRGAIPRYTDPVDRTLHLEDPFIAPVVAVPA